MERMMYEMEELIPIVAELSEQYTGYESTSIPYEKANQLMEAVIYCIHEYEQSGGNALAAEGVPAKEAYKLGYRLVDKKVREMMEMYHVLLRDFCSYGNIVLKDTVNAIPEFLKRYDIRYAPQDTILTLDYPLLAGMGEASGRTGIDAVYEYVRCICIEQRFLNQFPETYVIQVLRNYAEEHVQGGLRPLRYTQGHTVMHAPYGAGGLRPLRYEEIIENLCGIVLADVAYHILLNKQLDSKRIEKGEKSKIQAMLGTCAKEEAKERMRELVKHFIEEYYENDEELWQYLKTECDNMVVRLIHSVVS